MLTLKSISDTRVKHPIEKGTEVDFGRSQAESWLHYNLPPRLRAGKGRVLQELRLLHSVFLLFAIRSEQTLRDDR